MIIQDKDRLHNDEYLYGDISVKLHSDIVHYQKILVHLAPMEYKLLSYFLKNQGRVITRSELLINVWNSPAALSTRTRCSYSYLKEKATAKTLPRNCDRSRLYIEKNVVYKKPQFLAYQL